VIAQIVTTVVCLLGMNAADDYPGGDYPGNNYPGSVEGVVLDGSHAQAPLADVEVVLRAGREGVLLSVAQTTTDAQGRFWFSDLPVDRDVVYLAGANRDSVHYPGPRVRLQPAAATARVKLIAYEGVGGPSPLVAHAHEIDIQQIEGALEISESILVSNPTAFAYIGQSQEESQGDEAPVTLRLTVPDGLEAVTFAKEFHGRHFELVDGQLTTSIPWPPGERTIEFTYRLPVERRNQAIARKLDLPTSNVQICVRGDNCANVSCNLPRFDAGNTAVMFVSSEPLAVNDELRIELNGLAVSWIAYGRWIALGLLMTLSIGTAIYALRSKGGVANAEVTESLGRHIDATHGSQHGKSSRRKTKVRRSGASRRTG
jgi:hypothetical protein